MPPQGWGCPCDGGVNVENLITVPGSALDPHPNWRRARRLADDATQAAQQAADAAQAEADRVAGEARTQAGEARQPVRRAKQVQRRTAAAADHVTHSNGAATPTLSAMRKQELLELAAAKGVSGRSQMTKKQLVAALR